MWIKFKNYLTIGQKISTGGGDSFFTIVKIEKKHVKIKLKTGTEYRILNKNIMYRLDTGI